MRPTLHLKHAAVALLVLMATCAIPSPHDGADAGEAAAPAIPASVTPEIAVRPVPLAAAFDVQLHPAVAFGANEFLVVWEDMRNGEALYATRVDLDGRVLDPLGLRIRSGGTRVWPSVVFDGADFLIAWPEDQAVKARRVSPEGRLVESAPFALATAPSGRRVSEFALGQIEGTILATWTHSDAQGNSELWGARTHSGTSANTPFLIRGSFDGHSLSITPGLSEFLVAWATNRTKMVEFARVPVAEATEIKFPPGFVAGSYGPKVAFDGQSFVVSWSSATYPHRLYASRLSATEHPVDSSFLVAPAANSQSISAAVSQRESVGLVWLDHDISTGKETLFTSAISASSGLAPRKQVLVSPDAWFETNQVASAWGADRWLIVWADGRSGPAPLQKDGSEREGEIFAVMLNSKGDQVAREQRLSSSLGAQVVPSAAFDGQNYLVAWAEQHENDFDLYGARLSAGGQWLEEPFPISTAPNGQYYPQVAFDGSQFVVVWRDFRSSSTILQSDIYGARVSREGFVLDPLGIPIALGINSKRSLQPSIASGGGALWAHWLQGTGFLKFAVIGAKVETTGRVSNTISVVESSDSSHSPAAVFDGKQFVVTWASDSSQWAARMSPTGSVLDPEGIALSPPSYPNYLLRPAAASDGALSLLIWSTVSEGLVAARLGQDGKPLEKSATLAMPAPEDLGHSVAFDGQRFVAVWEERVDGQVDLVGRKISPATFELEPPFAFTQSPESEGDPVIVAGGSPGNLLLAYSKAVDGPSGAVPQLRLKLVFHSFGAEFESTPPASAHCGQPYTYTPTLSGADSYRFELAPVSGNALPEGLTVDETSGALSWTPSPAQRGRHSFVLWALGHSGAASQTIDLTVDCAGFDFRRQALGCTHSGSTDAADWSIALACICVLLRTDIVPRRKMARRQW